MTWFPESTDVAALALRAFLGAIMMVHGLPKLFRPSDRTQTISYMRTLGIPAPLTLAVGALEFVGGLAVLAGFLTQFAASLIAVEMVGTTILSRAKMGKKLVLGYELDLSYLTIALALVLLGAGAWSIDRALGIVVNPLWLVITTGVAAALSAMSIGLASRKSLQSAAKPQA